MGDIKHRDMKILFVVALTLLSQVNSKYISGDPWECPGNGLWPDPDNCACFYDCANLQPFHECCGQGTLFNDVMLICDYPEHVNCGDRPGPGSTHRPTTDGPPTTMGPTTHHPDGPGFPKKVLGMYILLADDYEEGWDSSVNWEPKLFEYQQLGANVLFFTFINPATMVIPESFKNLAKTRGTGAEGAVPADTVIIFAIGGYAYSIDPNPWDWLTSMEKAAAMAEQVATWKDLYGIDGIDLDIEAGAGDHEEAGSNLVHFINVLKSIQPSMIVSQPTYGYPQVQAEIDVINAGWRPGVDRGDQANSVGLMVYEGTQALQYVKNYAEGTSQWEGFPIQVDVPRSEILLGCKGSASSSTIRKLAEASISDDLLGIMVWYASVVDGLKYQVSWDSSGVMDSEEGYVDAMELFRQNM